MCVEGRVGLKVMASNSLLHLALHHACVVACSANLLNVPTRFVPGSMCLLWVQVIVAHRLSTIMDADQILVLAKGQVVESGSHAALVAAGGLYASMWARQQDSSSCAPSPGPKQHALDSSRQTLQGMLCAALCCSSCCSSC